MSTEKTDEPDIQYNTEQTRATRLKADTEAAYLDYRREHQISDAEALRRLVRDALDDTDETLDTVQKLSLFGGIAYIAVYLAGGTEATTALGGVFIVILLVWSSFPSIRAILSQIGG